MHHFGVLDAVSQNVGQPVVAHYPAVRVHPDEAKEGGVRWRGCWPRCPNERYARGELVYLDARERDALGGAAPSWCSGAGAATGGARGSRGVLADVGDGLSALPLAKFLVGAPRYPADQPLALVPARQKAAETTLSEGDRVDVRLVAVHER